MKDDNLSELSLIEIEKHVDLCFTYCIRICLPFFKKDGFFPPSSIYLNLTR